MRGAHLRTWLAKRESLTADYSIVGTYVGTGNFTQAWAELDSIPIVHDLSDSEQEAHGYYEDLLGFWEGITNAGLGIGKLDSVQVDTLEEIADNDGHAAGAIAKGMLNTHYGYNYQVVPLGTGGQKNLVIRPPYPPTGQTTGQAIVAYPNPAHQRVTFVWDLPDRTEGTVISVMDMKGREEMRQAVQGGSGTLEWRTDGLSPGVYFYQATSGGFVSPRSKLVLVK